MKQYLKIENVQIELVPTGTDSVPVCSISERIQEEKLSLLLWAEELTGNLDRFTNFDLHGGSEFRCSIDAGEEEHFSIGRFPDGGSLNLIELCGKKDGRDDWFKLCSLPELKSVSLFQLLQKALKYGDIKRLSYHFQAEQHGYSPFKVSKSHFNADVFPASPPLKYNEVFAEEYAIQWIINNRFDSYFPNGISDKVPEFPDGIADRKLLMAFNFTNEVGETQMRLFKAYRLLNQHHFVKCYLPLTHWYCKGKPGFTATVGLPDKQVLFNLHLLAGAETVILCSSPEVASAHQQANPGGVVVFTAFVCDGRQFEQVDFSPLTGKSVKLLISNHSGNTLAESYLEAQALFLYLTEKVKPSEIGFIQMEICYPALTDVYDVDALVGAYRQAPPRIVDGSVLELDEFGFDEMLSKANDEIERKRINSLDMPFWKPAQSLPCASPTKLPEKLTDKMIMRPIIVGGQITIIESAPGVGKTCFTTALCAQLAGSNAPFLRERCWTRCTPLDPCKQAYKVVYLIFDSDGAALIQEHRSNFAGDLGDCAGNFIQHDMSGDMNDYTQVGNYNKFLGLLKKLGTQGTPEQPVDVLVIDTLLSFARKNISNAFQLLQKLNSEYPNMAIILIHHLNKADETYGGVKGSMSARMILSLSRTEEQQPENRAATLEDTFTIKVEKFSNNKIPEDAESFSAKLDANGHFAVEDSVRTQEEMQAILVAQYAQKYSLNQEEIGRLFNVTGRTIRNWK